MVRVLLAVWTKVALFITGQALVAIAELQKICSSGDQVEAKDLKDQKASAGRVGADEVNRLNLKDALPVQQTIPLSRLWTVN